MEIKTTKQICLDNEVSWYDGYHTKWVSLHSLIHRINEIMDSKDVVGIEIVELYHELLDY